MGSGDGPAGAAVAVIVPVEAEPELPDGCTSTVRLTLLDKPGPGEPAAPEAGVAEAGSGRLQPRWFLCGKDQIRQYVVLIAVCLLLGAAIGYFSHGESQGSSHLPSPLSCPPVSPSCPPVPPSCPNKWVRSDGKCFFVSQEAKAWNSSLEICRSHGGTLLPPGNETQQEITSLYDLSGDFWIGLRKDTDSGQWRQLDGAEWTTDIAYDHAKMKCSCVNSGKYVALECSTLRRFICVRPL